MKETTFHSNGKLLLTGEYVVLDGAVALAIPTKLGQSLTISKSHENQILWQSFNSNGKLWFEAVFVLKKGKLSLKNSNKTAETLLKILQQAKEMNPQFLEDYEGFTIKTKLDFPQDWGLGSSSTLINNIAQWAKVDAFKLLKNSFGGSGYDIASAQHDTPIFFQLKKNKPSVTKVHLPWDFTESIFFVHLNKKQDSKAGIAHYKNTSVTEEQLEKISDLSKKLLLCYTLQDFENVMESHERQISEIVNLPTVKAELFPDFPNLVKSLGAWGGDFVLATGTEELMNYFRKKGYETIIPFESMVKK